MYTTFFRFNLKTYVKRLFQRTKWWKLNTLRNTIIRTHFFVHSLRRIGVAFSYANSNSIFWNCPGPLLKICIRIKWKELHMFRSFAIALFASLLWRNTVLFYAESNGILENILGPLYVEDLYANIRKKWIIVWIRKNK